MLLRVPSSLLRLGSEPPTPVSLRFAGTVVQQTPRRRIHTDSQPLTTPTRRIYTPTTSQAKGGYVGGQNRNMSSPADHTPLKEKPKAPAALVPSASVLLVSPTNQVLLLHRVPTASTFSSAHVFPGGALSPEHDGSLPTTTHSSGVVLNGREVETDLAAYRMAAIRETFEESGILLAKSLGTGKLFTDISDKEREEGRRAVHSGTILFPDLLAKWGCEPDTQGLIEFTRWITPPNVKKRFSTQMYLYLLPLGSTLPTRETAKSTAETPRSSGLDEKEADIIIGTPPPPGLEEADIVIPHPTHDGGIEHTAAKFLPPNKWIELARRNCVMLYPPQFFLTWTLAKFLSRSITSASSPIPPTKELQRERERLIAFLRDDGSFGNAIISPVVLGKGSYGEMKQDGVSAGRIKLEEGTAVLRLDYAGPELEEVGVRGTMGKWVVTTKFKKEGPRDMRVWERGEILGGETKL